MRSLETGAEVKKADAQGRLILPADWRQAEIRESRELHIIKRKGYLIVPKRPVDLTENFDEVDLGVEAIGSRKQSEKETRSPRAINQQGEEGSDEKQEAASDGE